MLLAPKRGTNVGAVCRAIANMGGGRLFIVGGDFDHDEARRNAVHAAEVFETRGDAASFEQAVADCAVVIGTTSRPRPWSIPVETVEEAMAAARRVVSSGAEVALVFGPEDRGLSNEELARCHRLACIPTAGDYASLNLAQAAVVCLYEWMRSAQQARGAEPAGDGVPAVAADQASALADLREVLTEIGFLHGDQAERVMASITSMLTRGGLDRREVSILRGIVRQVRWAARPRNGS